MRGTRTVDDKYAKQRGFEPGWPVVVPFIIAAAMWVIVIVAAWKALS